MPNNKKIIILHDYFLYHGGGERLVISMAKALKADVATAFIAKEAFDPRSHGIPTRELYKETWLSKLPGFRYLSVQFSFLFKTSFVKEYDIIIHSGDTLIAALRTKKGAKNVAYMHTPPRHLYDRYQERLAFYPFWKKIIFVPFAIFNRIRFEWLSKKLDLIITNSKNTQNRIKEYLGLASTVVYPPCDTLPFKNSGQGHVKLPSGATWQGFFFSYARLYDVKRVDKIVETFTKLPNQKLVVASGGPELEKIREMAKGHDNIQILGWITDEQLLQYIGTCRATVYVPVREDFGMSPVESMTAGKPVIGVAEGGMLEVIEDGKNGVMLKPDFTVEDLVKAVEALTPEVAKAMESACVETAKKFTEEKFVEGIREKLVSLF